ncbi:MAG: DUF488 family protein [Thermoanaerobaculia bacterium]
MGSARHIYTVGHSTRTFDELVELLRAFEVDLLVDIRTIPKSRHNPQFNRDELRSHLRSRRIRYVHLAELGGLRRTRKDSINTAWRNASFRGFADYMLTDEFEEGLAKLHALGVDHRIALMCAEAVPWRCHRSLVADALTARGARVEHIMSVQQASPHRMTPFAVVKATRVTYPAEDSLGMALATHGPFHLEATARVLQRRPRNPVDLWEPRESGDRYLRVLATAEGCALVEVTNRKTIDDPDLRLRVLGGAGGNAAVATPAARQAIGQTVRRILGLDVDPEPLERLAEAQRRLASTARALRGMRPPRFAGLFETFLNVVPFQHVSLDAGVAIVGRLVERFGEAVEHDGRRFHAVPDARVVARARLDTLKACGFSLRKAEALRNVARAIESGKLSEEQLSRLSSSEAVWHLTGLPGIGPWSASLVLLRGLGRLDVFPPGDVGVARGLGKLTGLSSGPALDRVVQRFGDRRGYLYFCSLGAALLAKDLIHAAPARPPAPRSELLRPPRSSRT